jgi:hypothetical protein
LKISVPLDRQAFALIHEAEQVVAIEIGLVIADFVGIHDPQAKSEEFEDRLGVTARYREQQPSVRAQQPRNLAQDGERLVQVLQDGEHRDHVEGLVLEG